MGHWIYLALSIVTEVAGTTSMKLSEGFTKPIFVLSIAVFLLRFVLLVFTICETNRVERSLRNMGRYWYGANRADRNCVHP